MPPLIEKLRNSRFHYLLASWMEKFESEGFTLSYSQAGEDLIIKSIFGKQRRNGCYVDVGCNNPIQKSNTFKLYLKGWRGINIDGNESLIRKFNKVRKRDINLNEVISTEKKELIFYLVKDRHELSTVDKETLNRILQDKLEVQEKRYHTKTLAEIFETHLNNRSIDLLSVDVEGHDLEVLRSNDFKKFRPRVICVESDANLEYMSGGLTNQFLTANDYMLIAYAKPNAFYIDKNNV